MELHEQQPDRMSSREREEIGDSKHKQHFLGVVLKRGTEKWRDSQRITYSQGRGFVLRREKLHHVSGSDLGERENR